MGVLRTPWPRHAVGKDHSTLGRLGSRERSEILEACGRADVRYGPPKQFHHTFAHRMLTAGEHIAAISVEMRHKNIGITAQFYAFIRSKMILKSYARPPVVRGLPKSVCYLAIDGQGCCQESGNVHSWKLVHTGVMQWALMALAGQTREHH